MISASVDSTGTGARQRVRRPVLIAMTVYTLGFVGAAAFLWHESQRAQSSRPPAHAGSSQAASP